MAVLEEEPVSEPSNQDISSLAKSPIDLGMLELELGFYNSEDREYLLDGFRHGFTLHYEGPHIAYEARNLRSALEFQNIVQDKINKEILAGRVTGPFLEWPIVSLRISPIGLVPKRTPGEYRLIHHRSYPQGFSVNDFIYPNICSVQYTSFDEAVLMMQDLGPNCKLFKMDLKKCFLSCP